MSSSETPNLNEAEPTGLEPSVPELPIYVSTATPRPPLTPEEEENSKKPKVLIVDAGLGGLTLAIMLHKAKVPFEIFERATEVKPLGTSSYIVARPDIYDLLLRQIPKEKIHMGKKVMSLFQNDNGVMIRCSDNTTHHGDILVGADGAYSGVRQNLYKALKKKKLLPNSDDVPLPFSCWVTFTTAKNICWMVLEFLDKNSAKENDSFRNSEWGPKAAEAMCRQVRHFKVTGGKEGQILTMGDLIDRTPKNLISKVMLEEKVFKHGSVVGLFCLAMIGMN
ncbi:hypothetical protein BGZ81_006858 [Podila clonocystis]|nr:hypothetical protein BGZ81_006858 [Podila clonocystis]